MFSYQCLMEIGTTLIMCVSLPPPWGGVISVYNNIYNSTNELSNIANIPRNSFNNSKINDQNIIRKIIIENKIHEIQFTDEKFRYDDMVKIIDMCDGLPINYNVMTNKSNKN